MPTEHPRTHRSKQLSVAILGCGKLGTSILQGLLSQPQSPPPSLQISHLDVTVRNPANIDRIQRTIDSIHSTPTPTKPHLSIHLQDHNGHAAREADIVILGCKPTAYNDILGDAEVREALLEGGGGEGTEKGKVLVSILGGVTIAQLEDCLYRSSEKGGDEEKLRVEELRKRCVVVRAIPNIAARIRQSVTVLSASRRDDGREEDARLLFEQVGPTIYLPEAQLNHASALAASSLAFYASIISAAADGAMGREDKGEGREGLSKEDAAFISAQAARGTSGLVITGEDPEDLLGEVATKGGSTAAGLEVMRKRGVREAVTEAVDECARVTANLSNRNQK